MTQPRDEKAHSATWTPLIGSKLQLHAEPHFLETNFNVDLSPLLLWIFALCFFDSRATRCSFQTVNMDTKVFHRAVRQVQISESTFPQTTCDQPGKHFQRNNFPSSKIDTNQGAGIHTIDRNSYMSGQAIVAVYQRKYQTSIFGRTSRTSFIFYQR